MGINMSSNKFILDKIFIGIVYLEMLAMIIVCIISSDVITDIMFRFTFIILTICIITTIANVFESEIEKRIK